LLREISIGLHQTKAEAIISTAILPTNRF